MRTDIVPADAPPRDRSLAAGGPINFRRGHVDVAIRRNDFFTPVDVDVIPLADEWMGPVVSHASAYNRPEDMNRLHSDTRPQAWAGWSEQANWQPTKRNMFYEHFYLAIQAAQAGQGVALASIHMVSAELSLGTLIAPHGFMRDGTRYCALFPAGQVDGRVQLFARWLARRMEESAAKAASFIQPPECTAADRLGQPLGQ
jgi:LysR family transcriptional regulator, glycine cleavage system transcriptional activator